MAAEAIGSPDMDHQNTVDDKIKLKREVGLFSGMMLVVGCVIGSGIFITPTSVLQSSGSIGADLIVWIVSGLLSIIGALCYAELGSMLPVAGADYAYLIGASKRFGRFADLPAFFYAWSLIMFNDPMSTASQGIAFANYSLSLVYNACPPPRAVITLIAIAFISVTGFVNCIAVKVSTGVNDFLSVIKCLTLVSIIVSGLVYLHRGNHLIDEPLFEGTTKSPGIFATSLYGALFSYSGWKNLLAIGEELKNPDRNVVRAIFGGIFLVTIIYVLTNIAYFIVLDRHTLLTSSAVAVSFATVTWGSVAIIIPILVSISCFGAASAGSFSTSRVLFCAAREGHFCSFMSYIHINTSIPIIATIFRALLSILYVFWGSIDDLINGATLIDSLFECFTITSLFILRYTMKEKKRPYRVPTFLAVIKLIFCIFVVVLPLTDTTNYANYGIMLAMTLIGGIFYTLFVRYQIVIPGYGNLSKGMQKMFQAGAPENELTFMLKES